MSQRTRQLKVISYEGSSYKTDFWEGQGREFEDLAERNALRRLLPPSGGTIMEIGAGFGRLADLYSSYNRVILLDYSLSLLLEAKKTFGEDTKYQFVAANVYHLPFVDNLINVVVMIRVAHHLESVPAALSEVYRVLQGESAFILEFANKRNIKAITRYLFRKQSWSPFKMEPYEFVPLNFDFHPQWMKQAIRQAGFRVEDELAISNFRLQAIKSRFSSQRLAKIDNMIAGPGAALNLSPSVLTKNISEKRKSEANGFFRCPKCGGKGLDDTDAAIVCRSCRSRWPIVDGVIDFRYPRPESD